MGKQIFMYNVVYFVMYYVLCYGSILNCIILRILLIIVKYNSWLFSFRIIYRKSISNNNINKI